MLRLSEQLWIVLLNKVGKVCVVEFGTVFLRCIACLLMKDFDKMTLGAKGKGIGYLCISIVCSGQKSGRSLYAYICQVSADTFTGFFLEQAGEITGIKPDFAG